MSIRNVTRTEFGGPKVGQLPEKWPESGSLLAQDCLVTAQFNALYAGVMIRVASQALYFANLAQKYDTGSQPWMAVLSCYVDVHRFLRFWISRDWLETLARRTNRTIEMGNLRLYQAIIDTAES
jgi:hypothetical protein